MKWTGFVALGLAVVPPGGGVASRRSREPRSGARGAARPRAGAHDRGGLAAPGRRRRRPAWSRPRPTAARLRRPAAGHGRAGHGRRAAGEGVPPPRPHRARDAPAPLLSVGHPGLRARVRARTSPTEAQRLGGGAARPRRTGRSGGARCARWAVSAGTAARAALRAQQSRETHPAVRVRHRRRARRKTERPLGIAAGRSTAPGITRRRWLAGSFGQSVHVTMRWCWSSSSQ